MLEFIPFVASRQTSAAALVKSHIRGAVRKGFTASVGIVLC